MMEYLTYNLQPRLHYFHYIFTMFADQLDLERDQSGYDAPGLEKKEKGKAF